MIILGANVQGYVKQKRSVNAGRCCGSLFAVSLPLMKYCLRLLLITDISPVERAFMKRWAKISGPTALGSLRPPGFRR